MYCISCKPIVEKQLKGEKGVKKIDINYITDSVVVEFDPNLIDGKKIKEKLNNSGYRFIKIAR